ncbi:MAG: nucleotide exchange factor GrpE [Chloroflexaceae bacterium]|nr:nucleotide exchange factor GrpE [Chloroflexaceae bacterium]
MSDEQNQAETWNQQANPQTSNGSFAQEPPHEGGAAEVIEVVKVESELEQRLSQAETQMNEYKDQWLRSVADFKNYKRRAESERDELKRNANAGLLLKLFPILDDIERAAENVPAEVAATPWWEGMRMITQKLLVLLETEGVTPIAAEGQEFDPNLHHAVTYEEARGQENSVLEVLQKGYMLRDRVLRPAMVKVGNDPGPSGPSGASEASGAA